MARQIRPVDATALLAEVFPLAENDYRDNAPIGLPAAVVTATERLFASETQAYREAMIGCAVARVTDSEIDIRLPATDLGENSFSGRSLADHVVTPFMRERAVPISASPYLSSLRGGARFVAGGQPRIQRDQAGFDALVAIVDHLRNLDTDDAKTYLRFLLRRFVQLRESVNITLKRIGKPNLDQLRRLIEGLLTIHSGGRLPAFLATAMFQTISKCHDLAWQVDFQGINVADSASGAVGDITIRKAGTIILGIEVTERSIDGGRVRLVFDQKVSTSGLDDYLFISTARPDESALTAARHYTAVGHEMNFVDLLPWLVHNLATIGPSCRAIFQAKMIELLSAAGVPAGIKVGWNNQMDAAIGV